MTAAQLMDHARELDADIAFLDLLHDAAVRTGAHPRIRLRLWVLRCQKAQEQGAAWGTKRVSP